MKTAKLTVIIIILKLLIILMHSFSSTFRFFSRFIFLDQLPVELTTYVIFLYYRITEWYIMKIHENWW